ncbi:MAG: LruC domain-containing protein [Chloroherpetonaceae bacterium]|nr:LruC domain-containing protein [Chloroherpetonaceae bacterium]
MILLKKQLIALLILLWIVGCSSQTEPEMTASNKTTEELTIPATFNFETVSTVNLHISAKNGTGSPLKQVKLSLLMIGEEGEPLHLGSGSTDANGKFDTKITVPNWVQEIYVQTEYLGLPNYSAFEIRGGVCEGDIAENAIENPFVSEKVTLHSSFEATPTATLTALTYRFLGTWNGQGVPNYLLGRDNVSQDLLDDINASLPETRPVPTFNPQYLRDIDMNTRLQDSAEVFVTFVHEGAGWVNALGFFTYELSNPPQSLNDIDSLTLVFPNVSYIGSGGGLRSGDKVKLGNFKAGTGIGWFLVPNAWQTNTRSVLNAGSVQTKYSVKDFNAFTTAQFRQHVILLKDESRQLLLLGFEDTSRPGGDNDFNDAIFYVTANPYTAVITEDLDSVQEAIDSDGDGVFDYMDEYPTDAARAFNVYAPAKNAFASLGFEDLYPVKGDYDFNDLVVDYNHHLVTNAQNRVVEMKSTIITRAIGGIFKNGFGFQLGVSPSSISNITGQNITENFIARNENGTEAGQSKAVIIAYDNAFRKLAPPAGFYTVNAQEGSPFITPDTTKLRISFSTPQIVSELGSSPFNPFIFVNKQRGYEVHLPNMQPTDLMNTSLFGTGNDNTLLPSRSYKTSRGLPWAIHIPVKFEYPIEKRDITRSYLRFSIWAESGGSLFQDWYLSKAGYRQAANLYR